MIVAHLETAEAVAANFDGIAVELASVGKARLAGIDVLARTAVVMLYVVPGESQHQQLAMLSDTFGGDEAALAAATGVNGRHVDRGKVGRIAVGNFVDPLILSTGARHDLAAVQDWQFLMIGGRLYPRAQIDLALERYDRDFRGACYESVMIGFVGILASSFGRQDIH